MFLDFDLSVCFLCSFLAHVGKKRTKETPHRGRGFVRKKQTGRIFAPFNILPLVDPPLAVEGGRECHLKVKNIKFHQSFPFGKGRLRDRALSFIKITATVRN